MLRRLAVLASMIVAVLLGACSGPAPQPPPPPSGGPTMPSETPSPSPSPSEQEHQDLLAIQTAYRNGFAEGQRLLADPSASKLTKPITDTTSGLYRGAIARSITSAREKNIRLISPGKIIGVSMGPWHDRKVTFYGCEDYSKAKWAHTDGSVFTRQPTRFVQRLVAVKTGGRWRIDGVDTNAVQSFTGARCNGTWYA